MKFCVLLIIVIKSSCMIIVFHVYNGEVTLITGTEINMANVLGLAVFYYCVYLKQRTYQRVK
jgi:hypothetical protein